MSIFDGAFINTQLSKRTPIFGLRLWVVIGIIVGVVIAFTLFLLSLNLTSRRRRLAGGCKLAGDPPSKEIKEIVHIPGPHMLRPPSTAVPEVHVDVGKAEHQVVVQQQQYSDKVSSRGSKGSVSRSETTSSYGRWSGSVVGVGSDVSPLGWGRWFSLREVEAATDGLCKKNVVGEGGYGIVYQGVLSDGTKVAV